MAESRNTNQEQLLRSERMAGLGQLAAGMAHEINNPIGFVKSNLNTLNDYVRVLQQLIELYDQGVSSAPQDLRDKIEALFDRHGLDYQVLWRDVGRPFLTEPGVLTRAIREAVVDELGVEPELSTGGGTSDGRFIAPSGAQVVEFGLLNATIHQVDERTPVEDLDRVKNVYRRTLEILLG